MSAFAFHLDSFITPVPSCGLDADYARVLGIFRQGQCDRIVITDGNHYPVGILYWHNLAPYLIAQPGEEEVDSPPFDPKQPLAELRASLIKPLTVLSARLKVAEFLPYLAAEQEGDTETIAPLVNNPPYALINGSGKFLGLLNQLHLLQSLIDKPANFLKVRSLPQSALDAV